MTYRLTQHAEERLLTRGIDPTWVERALEHPGLILDDELDSTLKHHLIAVPERDGRVLRVVFRPSADPVLIVTAHFDRGMKGKL